MPQKLSMGSSDKVRPRVIRARSWRESMQATSGVLDEVPGDENFPVDLLVSPSSKALRPAESTFHTAATSPGQ